MADETEEEKARKARREQIEKDVRNATTFNDVPFFGSITLLPPQMTAWITEFVGFWADKIATMVQKFFGGIVEKFQAWQDPKSHAMRKAFPNEEAIPTIKTSLQPALTELGNVANGMDATLAPKIQQIIAGATIDANGIEAAGKKANAEVVALVTKELETTFGKAETTKAAIEATAKSVAESVQGGVTTYLKAAQQIKGNESLTPENIGEQVLKLKLTFDPISIQGKQGITQLKDIKAVVASQAQAMEQAKALLLKDIADENIAITPEQTAIMNKLAFEPKLAAEIASKFGKEDWLKVFDKSATAIVLEASGEVTLKRQTGGDFGFKPQGTTATSQTR